MSITENRKTEGLGISGRLYLEITSPDFAKIEISRKTNIWGSDEMVKKKWGNKFVE